MQISLPDFFENEQFIPELTATNRDDALREMVDLLVPGQRVRDGGILLEMLRQREQLGSTGIGRGIAIPHGRSLSVSNLTVLVARSTPGIDFDPVEGGHFIRLSFAVSTPEVEEAIGRLIPWFAARAGKA